MIRRTKLETEIKHYCQSAFYEIEKTAIYGRIKGSQIFNKFDLGITLEQYIALDTIYYNHDICQRDLSKLILKDRSNTGRILNILEEKGFISRIVETKQKRLVKMIYITEKGKKLWEDINPKMKKEFSFILEDVSAEEFRTLRIILEKVRNSLSKNTNIQI